MQEIKDDFWKFQAHWKCIPTNGIWNKEKRAVMGAGLAKQAKHRFPGLDLQLGKLLIANGNIVQPIALAKARDGDYGLVSFPVKHHWQDPADIDLIIKSAEQLVELANEQPEKMMNTRIALPRVGCGNGQLSWHNQVKPILKEVLDHRFWIVDVWGPEEGA